MAAKSRTLRVLSALLLAPLFFVSTLEAHGSSIRVSTYELDAGDFSGATHTLTLSAPLETHYFVMLAGGSSGTSTRGPAEDSVRVNGDPHSNFATVTAADALQLSRGSSANDWIGSVQVIECVSDCSGAGFQLDQVLEVTFSAGSANQLQQVDTALGQAPSSRHSVFAGHRGGGFQTSSTVNTVYGPTAGVRWYFNGSDLRGERYGGGSRVPAEGTATAYVVEWGAHWTVQSVGGASSAGSNGAGVVGAYQSFTISSVARANTWVWGSGRSNDDGIGDGAFAMLYALGDGVAQNANETQVSVGAEYNDTKSATIFVFTNPQVTVEHVFKADGDTGAASGYQELTQAVSSAMGAEFYATGETQGYRAFFISNGCNGTGNAYSRPVFAARLTGDTTLTYWRSYSGQSFPAWFQIIDFEGM